MNAIDRAEILLTSRLLEAAGRVDWLATALTIVAAVSSLAGIGGRSAALCALALGIVAKLYFVRVALDARLLDDVASGRLETVELDEALAHLGKKAAADRSWTDRCRGARRLMTIACILTIAQCIALAVGGFTQ